MQGIQYYHSCFNSLGALCYYKEFNFSFNHKSLKYINNRHILNIQYATLVEFLQSYSFPISKNGVYKIKWQML